MPTSRTPGFVYLHSFDRAAKGVLSETDRQDLERELLESPEAGDVMKETGGVRKLRFGREGKGKRGDLRVIYYYRNNLGRIYMLTLYPKNVRDNLTMEQRHQMKALTARLDQEV